MGLDSIHVEKEGMSGSLGPAAKRLITSTISRGDHSRDTLIYRGGVEKTVRDDDFARRQGRKNFLREPIEHDLQRKGGVRILPAHLATFRRMLQQVPDASPRSASRPAREQGSALFPRVDNEFGQQANLGALAASLGSFETDEETCLTRVRHARIMNR